MSDFVLVSSQIEKVKYEDLASHQIAIVLDWWVYLSDLKATLPNLDHQFGADLSRSCVSIDGVQLNDTFALSKLIPNIEQRNCIKYLCTQCSVGLIVVKLQLAVQPLIVAELPRHTRTRKRRMQVNVATTSQRPLDIKITKALRLVDLAGDEIHTKLRFQITIDHQFGQNTTLVSLKPLR